ncbi:MAG: asparagine synthase-related protein [Candidatus Promineifilaceae bacterium]
MSFIFGRFHPYNNPIESDTPLPSVKGRHWRSGPVAFGYYPAVASDSNEYPLHHANSGLTITASVRLDNRADLLQKLAVAPNSGSQISDGQLILHAYQKWGAECPRYLLGDFAFAIWDAKQQQVFAARDFIGVRPFYYASSRESFQFASSAGALLQTPSISSEVDLPYLAAFFRHGQNYPHPSRTLYSAIRKLAPGHAMLIGHNREHTWRYWHPDALSVTHYRDESSYVEQLQDLLNDAVRVRIPHTGAVGAHLSGGLDCSSVAVLASRIVRAQDRPFYGYCWSPPITSDNRRVEQDERDYVEQIGAAEQIPTVYSKASINAMVALWLRHFVMGHDSEFVLEQPIRQHAVAQNVTTILSGWGGDEFITFNGRGHFANLFRKGRWLKLARELTDQRNTHGRSIKRALVRQTIALNVPNRLYKLGISPTLFNVWQPQPLPSLFIPTFLEQFQRTTPLPDKRQDLLVTTGVRATQLNLLSHGHLTRRMEGWAAVGLRDGFTYSYPMLDQRLVEFALRLPPEMFFKQSWTRYLFRKAVDNTILPSNIAWRKSKRDPVLNMERERIHDGARRVVRSLMMRLFEQTTTCNVLDLPTARRVTSAVLQGKPGAHRGILASVQVEQLFNQAFSDNVQNRLKALRRDELSF